MNAKDKAEIIRILHDRKGDDLARARIAFRSLTMEQMEEQHGQSGKTRAEILQGYVDHEANINRLIAAVEAQP